MERPILNFNFAMEPAGTEIVDSCNGLLLCSSNIRDRCWTDRKNYYVYNPTTNQSCELPQVVEDRNHIFRGIALAFDQVKSSHHTVVYFELLYALSTLSHRILLYSSEEPGAWTTAANLDVAKVHFHKWVYFRKGIYCNGSFHWICCSKRRNSLRFDIDNKRLYEMPSPPAVGEQNISFYLGQSCDHLHYIYEINYDAKFHLYEMKMDYSEWFVKYEVDLSSLYNAYPGMWSLTKQKLYYICGVVPAEHEETSFLVFGISGEAIKYNLVDKTFEHILTFPAFSRQFLYIETLCPVA